MDCARSTVYEAIRPWRTPASSRRAAPIGAAKCNSLPVFLEEVRSFVPAIDVGEIGRCFVEVAPRGGAAERAGPRGRRRR